MLKSWLTDQGGSENQTSSGETLSGLLGLLRDASDAEVSEFLSGLNADPHGTLASTPLYDQEATETLVRIMDLLDPDPEQSQILSQRFPLSWSVSVMGGEPFEVRPLINGVILVRNMHRVLGPALWEGVTFEMEPDLAEALSADLATLRGRNREGDVSCFLLNHDATGPRLVGSAEPVDLTAPGWGQLIAVCALRPEDLEGEGALRCETLRGVASQARSGVVFLRLFGDRVDLIPASRFDDDLDIFLEEMALYGLRDNVETGMELPAPLTGKALIAAIVERIGYETGHLPDEGPGAAWFRDHAVPALAGRLASAMSWGTVNFGLGPDPDGPRRAVPLPAGVEAAIAADPDLKRRSVTLQVMTSSGAARDMILDGTVLERISEAFEEVGAYDVELTVTGRVDQDPDAEAGVPPLTGPEGLSAALAETLERVSEQADREGEELEDAIINASLEVILLIDFPGGRPTDLTIAAAACTLSGTLEDTVRLFLNGRGEYLAYAEGGEDSGDHELFRIGDDEDGDDEDGDEEDGDEEDGDEEDGDEEDSEDDDRD